MTRQFTGRHMAMVLVAFFGVVITVNLIMARFAISTFGGVVVENSYVASQEFNRWLDEAAAEKKLGWDAIVTRRPDGRVGIELAGAQPGLTLTADARHPLGRQPDRALTFTASGATAFVSNEVLPAGRWTLRIAAHDKARVWRTEEALQ